jgi:hypothetical protein
MAVVKEMENLYKKQCGDRHNIHMLQAHLTSLQEGNSVRGVGLALTLGLRDKDGLKLGVEDGSADLEGLSEGVELGSELGMLLGCELGLATHREKGIVC